MRTIQPDGTSSERVYWRPEHVRRPEHAGMSAEDWRDVTLDALRLAVRRRMVADVPVGVLLSGGLDSSLVVALLADEGQVGLKTFSVGFHAAAGESGDEFEYSDLIAEHFATDHQQILVDPARLLPAVDSAIAAMAEPMVSHDCVAFYLLSEEVAKSVKVVQSGQGADEVFAGYSWYPPLASVPRARGVEAYAEVFTDRPHAELAQILEPEWLLDHDPSRAFVAEHFAAPGADETLDAALRLDSTIMLVDDPVKRVDNMTMAWGLEARVPFLDHQLVELAAACPPELKLAHGGKGVLKEAARGVVPDARHRPAEGVLPGAGDPAPGGSLPRPGARRGDRPGGQGPRAWSAADWLDAHAGRPEHQAHQPGFERVVAGGAAGDVAAGEGVVTNGGTGDGGLHRTASGPPWRVRSRSRRPTPIRSRSPDGALLGWISDRDGRPQVFVAPLPADGDPICEPEFAAAGRHRRR